VKLPSSVAVATTSARHGGQCWKSNTGWSARFGWSMYPTVSRSNTRLDGTGECNSAAVLVFRTRIEAKSRAYPVSLAESLGRSVATYVVRLPWPIGER
jgi:hypothetical protein